ncbi:cytochrome P450 85A1-like [Nymphaea colorata]|nr:cytochrome P450 85A1-like [Nymphaea colorata]
MGFLLVILGAITGFICFCITLLKWNEVRYRRKGLPPGTMGWPVFGETTEFLKYGPDFMRRQRARYGNVFKSHILGCPTVISLDPDLNRYILLNEGKGLIPGYPQSMLDLLGKWNIAAVPGYLHKAMRGVMFSLINTNMIRDVLLKDIDCFMRSHLHNWSDKVLDIQEQTKEMAFLLSLKQVAGISPGPVADAFRPQFYKLVEGTLSMPINLPGTNYRQGFQARENILKLLRKTIEERRASEVTYEDMLGVLLDTDDEKVKYKLTDDQILDLLVAIIYAGYETVSTTTMMAVKYLHDNPRALSQIREEHLEIRRTKATGEPLSWDDYKSMTFTRAVIYETLRLATVVNGVLRKTTKDMELKGFTIPKGWKIYVYMRETNFDPHIYPDPLAFNPWRWLEKNLEANMYFMMFGGGNRLCPGKELGTVIISVFLHYFVSKYRWEEVGGDKILKFPRVDAPNGLRIRVSDY